MTKSKSNPYTPARVIAILAPASVPKWARDAGESAWMSDFCTPARAGRESAQTGNGSALIQATFGPMLAEIKRAYRRGRGRARGGQNGHGV